MTEFVFNSMFNQGIPFSRAKLKNGVALPVFWHISDGMELKKGMKYRN